MGRVRRLLLPMLAIIGLLGTFVPSSPGADAPGAAAMVMSSESPCNHHATVPPQHMQSCATLCCAVLPSLPHLEPHVTVRSLPMLGQLQALDGIHLGLDPPPPRGT